MTKALADKTDPWLAMLDFKNTPSPCRDDFKSSTAVDKSSYTDTAPNRFKIAETKSSRAAKTNQIYYYNEGPTSTPTRQRGENAIHWTQ